MADDSTTPTTLKDRATGFISKLPDDTRAVAMVVMDKDGHIQGVGISMGLHQLSAMLVAGTLEAGRSLAAEVNGIMTASKTIMNSGLQAALASLNVEEATATSSPAATPVKAADQPELVAATDQSATSQGDANSKAAETGGAPSDPFSTLDLAAEKEAGTASELPSQ